MADWVSAMAHQVPEVVLLGYPPEQIARVSGLSLRAVWIAAERNERSHAYIRRHWDYSRRPNPLYIWDAVAPHLFRADRPAGRNVVKEILALGEGGEMRALPAGKDEEALDADTDSGQG